MPPNPSINPDWRDTAAPAGYVRRRALLPIRMLRHMRNRRFLFVLLSAIMLCPGFALPQTSSPTHDQQPTSSCFEVQGELSSWEGWEPNIVIRSGNSIFGVPEEAEMYPAWVDRDYPLSRNIIRGSFEICALGYAVKRPGSGERYQMYCVRSVTQAAYMRLGNEESDREWRVISPRPSPAMHRTCAKSRAGGR